MEKECASDSFLHDSINTKKAFAKVSRYTRRLPAETESYVVNRCAAQLEAQGGGNAIGMGDKASNMNAAVVSGIGVGGYTCCPQAIANIGVTKAAVRAGESAVLAQGFMRWNFHDVGPAKDVNHGQHWIECSGRKAFIFANGEIVF